MEKIIESLLNKEVVNTNKNKRQNNFTDLNDDSLGRINIKVFGIGGAGCNVIECMASSFAWNNSIQLYALNTDVNSLRRIYNADLEVTCNLLGKKSRHGMGTGGDIEIGKQIANEELESFKNFVKGADLVFFIAGLGKGTGSSITPIFSKAAKDMGICTVNIVTLPSIQAEGDAVYDKSLNSYQEIVDACDSFYAISNDKLINVYIDEDMTYEALLKKANMQVANLIKVICDILSTPSYTNISGSDILAFFKKTKIFTLLSTEIKDSEYSAKTINEKIASIIAKDCSIVPIKNAKSALANLITTPKTKKELIVNIKSILASYPNNAGITLSCGCLENPNSDTIKIDILISSNLTKEEILNNFDRIEANNEAPRVGILSQVPFNGESTDFGAFAKSDKEDPTDLPYSDGITINQFVDTTGMVHNTANFNTPKDLSDKEATSILESVYLKSKK